MALIKEIESDCLYVNYLNNNISQQRGEKGIETALEGVGDRQGTQCYQGA